MNSDKIRPSRTFSHQIFLAIYQSVIYPTLLILVFTVGALLFSKIRQGLSLRRLRRLPKNKFSGALWIHASSGEFEYAKPVIRSFKSFRPNHPVVVTYFSPSYEKAIENFEGVDFSLPLPLDLRGPTESFLKKLNPCALLIARTDLWPQLLTSVRARKIPSLLFSTTARPHKGIGNFTLLFNKFIYNLVDEIFLVSEEDQKNIEDLNLISRTAVCGDTRFDQVIYRIDHPKPLPRDLFSEIKTPVIVAGSTWTEDEAVLLPAMKQLLKDQKIKLIIAPHEPTQSHLNKLKKHLSKLEISFDCFSNGAIWKSEVLIIDKVGILAELYSVGDLAFVGGSFKRKVHSVMEPLASGLITFVGPFFSNNREATSFNKIPLDLEIAAEPLQMVNCVKSIPEFEKKLRLALTKIDATLDNKSKIKSQVRARAGATNHVMTWVEKQLNIKS